MTYPSKLLTGASRQKGLSLLELLVAMTIGLILIAGAYQIYISNQRSARFQQAQAYVQENIRYATHFMTAELQKAGFKPFTSDSSNIAYPALGATAGLCPAFSSGQVVISDGAGGICYRYQENGASLLGAGLSDCTGTNVAANAVIVSRVFLRNDPLNPTLTQLACSVLNAGALNTAALVDGITNLQILFGNDISNTTGGSIPDQMVDTYTLAPTALSGEFHTISVKVSIMARSRTDDRTDMVVLQPQTVTFPPAPIALAVPAVAAVPLVMPDREYYAALTSTILLKNSVQ